jgi:ribosome-binding factor A
VSHGHRGFSRADRVNEQIRRDLSELLQFEVKDPRIRLVSLTAVDISADYAHAKVYFTTLAPAEELADMQRGLAAAAGFLRRELGRRIRLHNMPELHFVHDNSIERGASLSALIDAAAEVSRQTPED